MREDKKLYVVPGERGRAAEVISRLGTPEEGGVKGKNALRKRKKKAVHSKK